MIAIGALLRSVSHKHQAGFWRGIAVMRSLDGRNRVIGFVLIAVFAQIARNWLMLHALGIDASVFDSIALLIGMVALSQLPVGPSVGAAAAVLILGANGVAIAAAAGVLLTATGTVGALGYMTWALADRLWVMRATPALSGLAPVLRRYCEVSGPPHDANPTHPGRRTVNSLRSPAAAGQQGRTRRSADQERSSAPWGRLPRLIIGT